MKTPNDPVGRAKHVENAGPTAPELSVQRAKNIEGLGSDYALKNKKYREKREVMIKDRDNGILDKILKIFPYVILAAFIFFAATLVYVSIRNEG